MRRVAVVVPAAGRGERLGLDVPKALVPVAGRPLLAWTLLRLQEAGVAAGVRRIVVALPPGEEALAAWREQVLPCLLADPPVDVVPGGSTRQASVWAGLQRLQDQDWDVIAVHDGARPFLSTALLLRLVEEAVRSGAAVPGLPPSDTIKAVTAADGADTVAATLPRAELRAVQTPQVFAAPLLLAAHRQAWAEGVEATDEAALVERLGHPVRIVPGDAENIKVTTPLDLAVAHLRLAAAPRPDEPERLRVGLGIDAHRFAEPDAPRPLVLGGVRLAERGGLAGHSDADVIAHAVMDALLGAAGLDDIGHLFPPGDRRYAGADSLELLRRVVALLAEHGWRPRQVDVAVVAARPRLAPHVAAMRVRLAEVLGLAPDAVGLKATTPEGLGSLGRGEGVMAWAVCVLRRTAP